MIYKKYKIKTVPIKLLIYKNFKIKFSEYVYINILQYFLILNP